MQKLLFNLAVSNNSDQSNKLLIYFNDSTQKAPYGNAKQTKVDAEDRDITKNLEII